MKRLLILIVLFTFAAIAAAETIHVPDDYGTIQGAIDAALAGDTIIVAPGTYEENIDFLGKAITVKSELGAEETIIDGSDPVDPDFGSVVTFMSGEGLDSVLDGFTLSYGTGYYNPDMGNTRGGGIAMELSSPTIVNNIINENTAEVGAGIVCDTSSSPVISNNTFTANVGVVVGGGIFCMDGSSPLITGNTFTANKALENGGGAIGCYIYSSPTITNNIFTANVSTGAIASGGAVGVIFYCDPAISNNVFALNSTTNDGGALYFWLSCNPTIENNIITNNSAGDLGGGMYSEDSILTLANNTITGNSAAVGGGGFYLYGNTAATISNTILWDNDAPLGSEGYVGDVDELTISYSDVEGGQESIELVEGATLNWGDGMIDEYPLFAIGPLGDFYLSQIAAGQAEDSPCVGTGDPAGELLWDTTRTDHCLDGLVNMGYHYPQTTVSPVLTCVPSSGTLPFETMMTVSLTNMYTEYGRRLAGQISLMTAGGITIINWRSGWANVGPGGSATAVLSPTLPAHPSLIGTNTVTLGAADMTPAPYNQPPYPPSGDTDTATCTVTGIAP